MVQDEVHQHANASGVGLVDEAFEVFVRAVIPLDTVVVRHIVAVVTGRLRDRHQPNTLRAQVVQGIRIPVVDVVELLREPIEVSDPVAVAVEEGTDEDLVADAVRPPVHCQRLDRISGRDARVIGWCATSERRGPEDGERYASVTSAGENLHWTSLEPLDRERLVQLEDDGLIGSQNDAGTARVHLSEVVHQDLADGDAVRPPVLGRRP